MRTKITPRKWVSLLLLISLLLATGIPAFAEDTDSTDTDATVEAITIDDLDEDDMKPHSKPTRIDFKESAVIKPEDRRGRMILIYWGDVDNNLKIEDVDAATDWSGSITANGKMAVVNPVRWDKKDELNERLGDAVTFTSMIGAHVDGLMVRIAEDVDTLDFDLAYTGEFSISASEVDEGMVKKSFDDYGVVVKRFADKDHKPEDRIKGELQKRVIDASSAVGVRVAKAKAKFQNLAEDCREFLGGLEDYNFVTDDEVAGDFEEFQSEVEELADLTESEFADRCARLKNKFNSVVKPQIRKAKKRAGIIDFNDVDDDEWFHGYVSRVKGDGIVEGYKNQDGELTGEFGPGNNITIGELLKVSAKLANESGVDGETENENARSHWAKRYLKAAENRGLSLVENKSLNLNRPATRGEVLRMVLEFLEIVDPEGLELAVENCEYSDLSESHPHYMPICIATEYGIVSGDDNEDGSKTFRPNASVNRAEIAKILTNVKDTFVDDESEKVLEEELGEEELAVE